MKADPLLGLVVLATGALCVLLGGCVAEEEVEQEPSPTPWHSPSAPTAAAFTVEPTRAHAPTSVGTTPPMPSPTQPTAVVEPIVSLTDSPAPTPTPAPAASPTPKTGRAMVAPADFVEMDANGKYFIPDDGEDCYYVEVWRVELEGELWVGLQAPDCSEAGDLVWEFAPGSGGLRPVLILQEPFRRQGGTWPNAVVPSFFQQRADGTYFAADAGDGCSYYEEVARYTKDGKEWVMLQSATCGLAILISPGTLDKRLIPFAFKPPDLSPSTTPALRWPNPFPTVEEVQLGPDGKYIIRGRGDGCDYDEGERSTRPEDGRLWILLRSPQCALVGLIVPGLEGDLEVMPIPTPPVPPTPGVAIERSPDRDEMRQDGEGRYFVPDRGDRCVWIEEQRLTLTPLHGEEHVLVFLYSEECQPDFFFWYDPTEQRIFASERYVPEGTPLPNPLWPLPVAVEDIQQDDAGEYFVAARADGCAYRELGRPVIDGKTWAMLSAPGCYILWRYAPATGELFAMDPLWWPIREMPSPSDFELDADGKYYLPDRGDGCPWREQNRFLDDFPNDEEHPQHLIINFTSDCGSGSSFRYDITAGELSHIVS